MYDNIRLSKFLKRGKKMKKIKLLIIISIGSLSLNVLSMGHATSPEAIAEEWVAATFTGKEETRSMVTNHLADDGIQSPGRYVGFGFQFDPNADKGKMKVTYITPGSPASEVLKVGDEFVSVRGVQVREGNMDKLSFRGKPGEKVKARIKRDGRAMNIEVARGVIAGEYSKSGILDNINSGDGDNWAADEFEIMEVLSKDNIVYVLDRSTRTEQATGLPYKAYKVTRFVFNENGMVSEFGALTEDRFILEQQGYTISR
tara:strand:+ start:1298 stop:2071 length:774 start_codon:yes stop_codon:yes gene_type:complete